jgi:hypothetical protein
LSSAIAAIGCRAVADVVATAVPGCGAPAGRAPSAADPEAAACSMSFLMIRPCGPEPLTRDRSMAWYLAIRRASGEANRRWLPAAAAGA